MKMKNKSKTSRRIRRIQQSCSSKPETFLDLGFRFIAFSFLVFAFCFSVPVSSIAVAGEQARQLQTGDITVVTRAAHGSQKPPQSGFIIKPEPNIRLGRQLWQARIDMPGRIREVRMNLRK